MRKASFILVLCGSALASCSPKVTTTFIKANAPLAAEAEVTVLSPEAPEPEHAVPLQTIKLAGRDYDALVRQAEDLAREAGGNTLQIVNHLNPDISSSQHRMGAVILSTECEEEELSRSQKAYIREVLDDATDLKMQSKGFRIGIQGGGALRIGTVASDLEPVEVQHLKNLMRGLTYGADITYFFSENFGLGLKFHNLFVSDKMPASVNDGHQTVNGYLEDDINIAFLGPVFTFRLPSRNRNNAFFARAGLGATGYFDRGRMVKAEYAYRATGYSLGLLYEIGYDFSIAKNLSAGASVLFLNSSMRAFRQVMADGTVQTFLLEDGESEALSHVGLSIGLRDNL